MLKRMKTVSMMLFLMGAITGTAYASPSLTDADNVRITQQTGTCTGTVKDATGEPVIGASVVIKGTTTGTITDFDGKFSLPDAKRGAVIQISFVGYETMEMTWNGSPLNITLKDDTQALEEVVGVGYGVQKKVNLTGAVASVKGEALEHRPVADATQSLQGTNSFLFKISSLPKFTPLCFELYSIFQLDNLQKLNKTPTYTLHLQQAHF